MIKRTKFQNLSDDIYVTLYFAGNRQSSIPTESGGGIELQAYNPLKPLTVNIPPPIDTIQTNSNEEEQADEKTDLLVITEHGAEQVKETWAIVHGPPTENAEQLKAIPDYPAIDELQDAGAGQTTPLPAQQQQQPLAENHRGVGHTVPHPDHYPMPEQPYIRQPQRTPPTLQGNYTV